MERCRSGVVPVRYCSFISTGPVQERCSAVPMVIHCAGELKPPILSVHIPFTTLNKIISHKHEVLGRESNTLTIINGAFKEEYDN